MRGRMRNINIIEFLSDAKTQPIDTNFIEKLENVYGANLDEYISRLLSYAPSGAFFEGDGASRILSHNWILDASDDMAVDFIKWQLIPVFDMLDNDFICYDVANENWCMFNIAEELKFNEGKALEGCLGVGGCEE